MIKLDTINNKSQASGHDEGLSILKCDVLFVCIPRGRAYFRTQTHARITFEPLSIHEGRARSEGEKFWPRRSSTFADIQCPNLGLKEMMLARTWYTCIQVLASHSTGDNHMFNEWCPKRAERGIERRRRKLFPTSGSILILKIHWQEAGAQNTSTLLLDHESCVVIPTIIHDDHSYSSRLFQRYKFPSWLERYTFLLFPNVSFVITIVQCWPWIKQLKSHTLVFYH